MMKKLIALLAVSTLVLSGCTWFQSAEEADVIVDDIPVVEETAKIVDTEDSTTDAILKDINKDVEILLYSTEGVDATLTQKEATFDYTVAKLESMANECGTSHEEGYFDRLVEAYKNTPKYTYSFKYNGESQDPDTFTATVLLNRMEYTDFENVKADFDQCFAGGDMYPAAVSMTHILFVRSCGTGFADGSDNPIGCAEVREVVEPTLKLNPEFKAI